jgi:hypothetical protein
VNTQMGLEIAYIRWKDSDRLSSDDPGSGLLDQSSLAQCVGPQIGVGADYELFCLCKGTHSFSLTGQFLGSLLAAHISPSSRLQRLGFSTTTDYVFQKLSRVVPSWQLRLGLEYLFPFFCFPMNVQVGYEVRDYLNSVYKQQWENAGADGYRLHDSFQNFALQGLYVRAGMHF